jgi:hypothetical protein
MLPDSGEVVDRDGLELQGTAWQPEPYIGRPVMLQQNAEMDIANWQKLCFMPQDYSSSRHL